MSDPLPALAKLQVPLEVCVEMIQEALAKRTDTASTTPSRDANTERFTAVVPGVSTRVFPFPVTERLVAVYCIASGVDGASLPSSSSLSSSCSWAAIDAKCFHARADLSMGTVRRSIGDIENLGDATGCDKKDPLSALCVECPGHGFLFSLWTGDNLVPNAKFSGKNKMSIQGLKGVKGMQRPYHCSYEETAGLTVVDAGTKPRYACETK